MGKEDENQKPRNLSLVLENSSNGLTTRISRQDWPAMFGWLLAAYPMASIPSPTTEVYWQVLRTYSPARVKAAFLKHVKRNRFFPALAELVELTEAEPCPHSKRLEHETACQCGEYGCLEHKHPSWKGQKCTECGDVEWTNVSPWFARMVQ